MTIEKKAARPQPTDATVAMIVCMCAFWIAAEVLAFSAATAAFAACHWAGWAPRRMLFCAEEVLAAFGELVGCGRETTEFVPLSLGAALDTLTGATWAAVDDAPAVEVLSLIHI